MSRWIDRARAAVAEVVHDIPAEATLSHRRKALRAAGPLFHGNTYCGRKSWGRACREYLAKHGGPAVPASRFRAADIADLESRIATGDVIFPFRSSGQ